MLHRNDLLKHLRKYWCGKSLALGDGATKRARIVILGIHRKKTNNRVLLTEHGEIRKTNRKHRNDVNQVEFPPPRLYTYVYEEIHALFCTTQYQHGITNTAADFSLVAYTAPA